MKDINVPSYSHLISRDSSIKAIVDLYDYISRWKQEVDNFINGTTTDDMLWIGAGQTYTDVKVAANMIPVNWTMRVDKDVTCTDGDNIIIVIDSVFYPYFHRADMSGTEMSFVESEVTITGRTYKILTSSSTYQTGVYNVDING